MGVIARQPPDVREVCARFVLSLREMPPAGEPPDLAEGAIVGGSGPLAEAFHAAWLRAGGACQQLDPEGATGCDQIDACMASGWYPHLILFDESPRSSQGVTGGQDRLIVPLRFAQRWLQRVSASGRAGETSLVCVTSVPAGIDPIVHAGQGMAGLVKAVLMEGTARGAGGPRTRQVTIREDASPDTLALAVRREHAELMRQPSPTDVASATALLAQAEIVIQAGRRSRVMLASEPVSPGHHDVPKEGCWLVTGGARGVTAVTACVLARRYGLKLHLLGTTELGSLGPAWSESPPLAETDERDRWTSSYASPEVIQELRRGTMLRAKQEGTSPTAAWDRVDKCKQIRHALARYSAAGVLASYSTCSLTDAPRLAEHLARIERAMGPIVGVIHGAGVERTRFLDRKTPADFEATFSGKVGGALAIEQALADKPPRYVLAYGSLSGRFGGIGQADYAIANAWLGEWADRLRRRWPGCRATVFDWPAWGDLGMAMREESRRSLSFYDTPFMPAQEGVAHLLAEVAAGLPSVEVVIAPDRIVPEELKDSPADRVASAVPR